MGAGNWSGLWSAFLALLAREPAHVNILAALAAAFLAVMALEGIRSSFFPRRMVAIASKPQAENPATGDGDSYQTHASAAFEPMLPAAPPRTAEKVKRAFPRRSSPAAPRILGVRKPS
ncbi:MAG TPA: hypothetical protein VLW75_11940 [Rhizomicrobium sp.]|nr:hypothetical protein [Rhizomicrobium sp.]